MDRLIAKPHEHDRIIIVDIATLPENCQISPLSLPESTKINIMAGGAGVGP